MRFERALPDMFDPGLLLEELLANGVIMADGISHMPPEGYPNHAVWVEFDVMDVLSAELATLVVEAHDPDYQGSVRILTDIQDRARADARDIMQKPGFQAIKKMGYLQIEAWFEGLTLANQREATADAIALLRDWYIIAREAPDLFDW